MRKLLIAALCAVSVGATGARAEVYPSRPIIMIAPLGVGGSTDVVARVIAQGMSQVLGQNIAVENVTGAGGTIGEARIARATPDGYTIGIGQWGTNVANGAIYPLTYDLMKDFEPIGMVATQPFLIVARKSMPANNLKELIEWLRANAGKANEGNSGVGSPSHVAGLLFQKAIGANFTMVPYRGAGESTQALISEQIDVLLNVPGISMGQIKAGAMKAYAVTAPTRATMAPDIPTTDEAGLPVSIFPSGTRSGRRRARPRTSSPSSTTRWSSLGRSGDQKAADRYRTGDFPARTANAGGASHVSAVRDRQMVADHQGGQHQGGVIDTIALPHVARQMGGSSPASFKIDLAAGETKAARNARAAASGVDAAGAAATKTV